MPSPYAEELKIGNFDISLITSIKLKLSLCSRARVYIGSQVPGNRGDKSGQTQPNTDPFCSAPAHPISLLIGDEPMYGTRLVPAGPK
ncbi:unnamed protein product [Tuber melanosporum]|uniref:(Perigord truffle) hypothetical protein n=1 Tax=Tuber melanosporum (strain Mel28) TaxID=656061 RepID=D5G9S6_TUBMM|nr:uncharacterized protein GSTUM_00005053001 [Tuber melanosporum]CAZ81269.1 unnamed protein product [Tuber melanosporum]